MAFDVEQAYKELAEVHKKTFLEDMKIILGFFGFKAKENHPC
jgi:hypothetical protein